MPRRPACSGRGTGRSPASIMRRRPRRRGGGTESWAAVPASAGATRILYRCQHCPGDGSPIDRSRRTPAPRRDGFQHDSRRRSAPREFDRWNRVRPDLARSLQPVATSATFPSPLPPRLSVRKRFTQRDRDSSRVRPQDVACNRARPPCRPPARMVHIIPAGGLLASSWIPLRSNHATPNVNFPHRHPCVAVRSVALRSRASTAAAQSVRGTATFRERMALPPDATFRRCARTPR